jgi:hypothetical protein
MRMPAPGRNRCARRVCSVCTIYKRYAVAERRMPASRPQPMCPACMQCMYYIQAICSGRHANAGTRPQPCARHARMSATAYRLYIVHLADACKLYAANSNAQASGESAPSKQMVMARGGPHKQSSKKRCVDTEVSVPTSSIKASYHSLTIPIGIDRNKNPQ